MHQPHQPLRVMLVDDDPVSRTILEEHVTASGHDVFVADSATRAMYMLERAPAHIVLADWVMPEVSGLDLCRWVRRSPLARSPHFVIITAHSDRDRLVEAFDAGADDFLAKPFHEAELLARLRAWTRIMSLQDQLTARHEESTRLATELLDANRRLAELASTDDLTGLLNRREAHRRLNEHLAVADRYDHPFACALIDVDRFKWVNDTLGHGVGDRVLRHISTVLRDSLRTTDFAFRMGGDEFLVLLPNQRLADAARWADRFRAAIASRPFAETDAPLTLSASIGFAERSAESPTSDALLEEADRSLYLAKSRGRDAAPTLAS